MDPPATTSSDDIVTVDDGGQTLAFKDQVRSDIYTCDASAVEDARLQQARRSATEPQIDFKDQVNRLDDADEEDQRVPVSALEIVEAVPVSRVTDKDLSRSTGTDLFDLDGQRNRTRDTGSSNSEPNQTKRIFCMAMILALASFIVAVMVAILCLTGRCKSPVTVSPGIPQTSPDSQSVTSRPQTQPQAIPIVPATAAPTSSPLTVVAPPVQLTTSMPVPNPPSLPVRSTEIINYINGVTLFGDGASPIRYPVQQTTATTPEERGLTWLIDIDTEATTSTAAATQSLRQRYALSTLWFQSPEEPSFTNSHTSTWTNPLIDECDWLGVECNTNGAIVRLNLEESNVRGQLPADLGLLTELTTIRMWENAIQGTLPSALRRLTNLRELRLWDNRLTGTIPPWIGELTALRLLELDINAFEGTIPSEIGLLTALTIVDLAPNNLTGTMPTALLQLTELRELLLYNNDLTGTNPFCVGAGALNSFSSLVVDCNEVDCPCCTQCCGGGQQGVATRQDCDA